MCPCDWRASSVCTSKCGAERKERQIRRSVLEVLHRVRRDAIACDPIPVELISLKEVKDKLGLWTCRGKFTVPCKQGGGDICKRLALGATRQP